MCGRFSIFAELDDLADQFRFNPAWLEADYRPSWNVGPTAPILVIKAEGDHRTGGVMRWGFVFPSRKAGGGSSRPLFNARSETLTERPAFRTAFANRRCLVPVNGFYEWQGQGDARMPLWIHRRDEKPFALAGIYRAGPDEAACVITCAPNSLMEYIHNRMPVILTEDDYDAWLAAETDPAILQFLLAPKEWPDLTTRPVSRSVNRIASDGPRLIAPAVSQLQLGQ